jgi:hypothetical protein
MQETEPNLSRLHEIVKIRSAVPVNRSNIEGMAYTCTASCGVWRKHEVVQEETSILLASRSGKASLCYA